MEGLHEIKEMLMREVEEMSRKGELDYMSLDTLHKLTDTIKNIDKIMMLERGGYSRDGGTSRAGNSNGNSYSDNSYGAEDSYNSGESYRRRRDARGRYSREDGRDQMVNQLEGLMGQAGTDHEREAIRRCMEQLRGM